LVFEPEESAYYCHSYGQNATLAITSDAKYAEEGEA
jgi:predicted CxxxxCH...CXXCH cytochrome family protein